MANELTRYIPTEMSDSEGNVRYPHTLASVTFMDDGQRVQTVLARLDHLLEDIETVTSSSEIDENTALVTAAALAEVKQLYTSLSSDIDGLDGTYELLASTQSASIVTLEVQSLSSYRWLLLSHYNPSTGHTDCSCMIPSCMFGTAFRDITTRYTGTGTSYIYAYGAECIYKSDTSIQLRIFRAEGGYAATLWGIT